MSARTRLFVSVMAFFFCTIGIGLCQDAATTQAAPATATVNAPAELETQWIWGEVVSVDAAAKTIKVKYLDYDSDQEKEMGINTDEKTSYENIKSFDEIKEKDAVSIDYVVAADSRNLARNISVEKAEMQAPAPELEEPVVPAAAVSVPAAQ